MTGPPVSKPSATGRRAQTSQPVAGADRLCRHPRAARKWTVDHPESCAPDSLTGERHHSFGHAHVPDTRRDDEPTTQRRATPASSAGQNHERVTT